MIFSIFPSLFTSYVFYENGKHNWTLSALISYVHELGKLLQINVHWSS